MSPGQQSHIVPWEPDYQPIKNEVKFFRTWIYTIWEKKVPMFWENVWEKNVLEIVWSNKARLPMSLWDTWLDHCWCHIVSIYYSLCSQPVDWTTADVILPAFNLQWFYALCFWYSLIKYGMQASPHIIDRTRNQLSWCVGPVVK